MICDQVEESSPKMYIAFIYEHRVGSLTIYKLVVSYLDEQEDNYQEFEFDCAIAAKDFFFKEYMNNNNYAGCFRSFLGCILRPKPSTYPQPIKSIAIAPNFHSKIVEIYGQKLRQKQFAF
jgi:hypothetical protein